MRAFFLVSGVDLTRSSTEDNWNKLQKKNVPCILKCEGGDPVVYLNYILQVSNVVPLRVQNILHDLWPHLCGGLFSRCGWIGIFSSADRKNNYYIIVIWDCTIHKLHFMKYGCLMLLCIIIRTHNTLNVHVCLWLCHCSLLYKHPVTLYYNKWLWFLGANEIHNPHTW